MRVLFAHLALIAAVLSSTAGCGRVAATPERDAAAQARGGAEMSSMTAALTDRRLTPVRLATAAEGTLAPTIRTHAVVQYDERRLVDINLKVDGWITELFVNYAGRPVQRGERLYAVYSPDLYAAATQFVAAVRNRDQMTAQPGGDQAFLDRVIETPLQRLQRWDVPEDQIREMQERRQPPNQLVFRSPAAGVVIQQNVVAGMHAAAGQTLMRLADLSMVWIEAAFPESDLPRLLTVKTATITVDAWPGERWTGRVVSVLPAIGENRTVPVRFEIQNREGRLRAGMFANVEIEAAPRKGVIVPVDAVVDSGTRQVVFVADREGAFTARVVSVGHRDGDRALIASGLGAGERVATGAAFLLESETPLRSVLDAASAGANEPGTGQRPNQKGSVTFEVSPDPPAPGPLTIEAAVADAENRPVVDADVTVVLSMPAMPSMNMPAMHVTASLAAVSNGRYRGTTTIGMPGRWDATVVARRGGTVIATRQTGIQAR